MKGKFVIESKCIPSSHCQVYIGSGLFPTNCHRLSSFIGATRCNIAQAIYYYLYLAITHPGLRRELRIKYTPLKWFEK